ncbi:MAG: NHL repeat-containing protein [Candidatus Acidiferrales bacterium]
MHIQAPISTLLIGTVVFLCAACSPNPRTSANVEAQSAPPPLEYVGEWGTKGDGPGQLRSPARLAVDATGSVYIADSGSGYIHKFGAQGEPRLSFQDDRRDTRPGAVAVDASGAIYAADGESGTVFVYLPEGKRFKAIHCCPAKKGATLAVAVAEDGKIFVADGGPMGVRTYSVRGRLLGTWGQQSKGQQAAGTIGQAVDLAIGPDGLVYVADATAAVIHVFTRAGRFQRNLRLPDRMAPASLAGISVTDRWVFAADPEGHAVHIWSVGGEHRLRSDLDGRLAGSAESPQDVAVTPDGELLVLDPAGGRVLHFRLHL